MGEIIIILTFFDGGLSHLQCMYHIALALSILMIIKYIMEIQAMEKKLDSRCLDTVG